MHTVIETPAYIDAADDAGMTRDERDLAVTTLANDPQAGAMMKGTGGCRKVRIAGKGKGKSGGYRVITFFAHKGAPVFLLTTFSKGEKANLTKKECAELAKLSKTLIAALGPRAIDQQRTEP
jgi:hypothetical protein